MRGLAAALLALWGCTNDYDSFLGAGGASSSSAASNGGAGGAGAATSASSGGAGGLPGGASSGGGTGGVGGAASTGGAPIAGSGGVGGSTGGSGGQPSVGEIACEEDVCIGAEVCCIESQGPLVGDCKAAVACNQVEAYCDGPEDCGDDELCCGVYNGSYSLIACSPTCDGSGQIEICGASGMCQPGASCLDSTSLGAPWKYCD
jgi:hypothetical protein